MTRSKNRERIYDADSLRKAKESVQRRVDALEKEIDSQTTGIRGAVRTVSGWVGAVRQGLSLFPLGLWVGKILGTFIRNWLSKGEEKEG